MTAETVDVVIVGTGFGGSVVAEQMAAANRSVVVLERGKRHRPGTFPRDPRQFSSNMWDPKAGLYGMFDIWSFRKMAAIVSSGVGGGSLIYANVLLRKDPEWFTEPLRGGGLWTWPISREELDPHYDEAEDMLGVETYPYPQTRRTHAMSEAAVRLGSRTTWQPAPLGVTFTAPGSATAAPDRSFTDGSDNMHNFARRTCRLCGECDIGCNDGAKNTLDLTCLSRAVRNGADLRDLHEVRSIAPLDGGGYSVRYVVHSGEAPIVSRRTLPEHELRCRQLVLSAGALATPYLLMRSGPPFSSLAALGSKFSGNGDLLSILRTAPTALDPSVGPVITSTFRMEGPSMGPATQRGHYVQDGGNPAFVSWLYETLGFPRLTTRAIGFATRRTWAHVRGRQRANISGDLSRLLASKRSSHSMPILAMGRDTPWGSLSLGDDGLELDWKLKWSKLHFDAAERSIADIAAAIGARPSRLSLALIKRAVTVHPLGGCPMGRDADEGVVDSYGRVFGHDGLFIADGSVMPGPVGPNPSLTIAAMAHRSASVM
jgi:cholesterol oxidase